MVCSREPNSIGPVFRGRWGGSRTLGHVDLESPSLTRSSHLQMEDRVLSGSEPFDSPAPKGAPVSDPCAAVQAADP